MFSNSALGSQIPNRTQGFKQNYLGIWNAIIHKQAPYIKTKYQRHEAF